MDNGASQGEALFPPGCQRAGEALAAFRQSRHFQNPLLPLLGLRGGNFVDTTVEVDVLLHGEVIIEGELLGHIADDLLDLLGLGHYIEAFHMSLAGGWPEKAAEHPDRGGFPGSIGAKKPEDLSPVHLKADVVNGYKGTEDLDELVDLNGI